MFCSSTEKYLTVVSIGSFSDIFKNISISAKKDLKSSSVTVVCSDSRKPSIRLIKIYFVYFKTEIYDN